MTLPAHLEPRWWQSVRTRFGVLLGLALFPWLLLTTLGALSDLDRTRLSQSQLSDVIAANTVRDIGRTLEAGRLALDAAPLLISEWGCERGSQEVLDRLVVYEALIVLGEDTTVLCQTPPSIAALVLENPQPFDADEPFRIERARIMDDDETERTVVAMQTRIRSTGDIYTLVLPKTLGPRDVIHAALGNDARLSLTKPDGTPILGITTSNAMSAYYRSVIKNDTETLLDVDTEEYGARRIATRFFENLGVYVTVGRSQDTGGISSIFNPYTAILLPILAWLIGFGLIWIGAQTMLLTPISKVRHAARKFSNGRLGSRVDLSGSAAAEVHGLANSFNHMAEQLQERETKIADNLDEKDTLMREIHHRVKNNLQIIISLLNMQERKAESKEAVDAIAETRTRINAIAIVHRGLYESDDLRQIDMGPFVSRLMSSMGDSLGTEEAGINLTQSAVPCKLSADNAIPIALFIVEAISNSAEHGVERGGEIHVAVTRPESGKVRISVGDNGRGVGNPDSMRGVGTKLMRGFARQLSGTLTFSDNSPGLVAHLDLPVGEPEEQPFQVSRKRK